MPDIRNILNCSYPSENILEEFNKYNTDNKLDTIHLYIDLKNALSGLFVPEIVEEMVNNTNALEAGVDSSIFQSILYTIYSWKNFCKNLNVNYKIFICNDKGRSSYHYNILKEYKSNRKISNFLLAKYNDALCVIKEKNFDLCESILNKFNNVHFISLNFIESDFLPYYLISRHFKDNENIFHIIASNDKDHLQNFSLNNKIIMYSKKNKEYKVQTKDNMLNYFIKSSKVSETTLLKNINLIKNIDIKYFPLMLAICGDISDNIPGVKSLGPKRVLEMFNNTDYINKYLNINSIEEIYDRVFTNNELILKPNLEYTITNKNINVEKYWNLALENNELLTKSFKLISFENLCKWLEFPDKSEKLENIEKIKNIIEKNNIEEYKDSVSVNTYLNRLPNFILKESMIHTIVN